MINQYESDGNGLGCIEQPTKYNRVENTHPEHA